jgi:galactose mutarotase-like enzyme
MNVEIEHQRYGVDLIKIDNEETKIVFTNYGARIVSWKYQHSLHTSPFQTRLLSPMWQQHN